MAQETQNNEYTHPVERRQKIDQYVTGSSVQIPKERGAWIPIALKIHVELKELVSSSFEWWLVE